MNVSITRRTFLGAGLAVPFVGLARAATVRAPYVEVGEYVDSIIWHLWERPVHTPIGPVSVHEILPWNGEAYPIILAKHGWRPVDKLLSDGWLDSEWSNLRREAPEWYSNGLPDHRSRYPNIHSYVREKRFGEHPSVMRETMDRNSKAGPAAFGPRQEPAWRSIRQPALIAAE